MTRYCDQVTYFVTREAFFDAVSPSCLGKEHWIGLDNIYWLAKLQPQVLTVRLSDVAKGKTGEAHYKKFSLKDQVE